MISGDDESGEAWSGGKGIQCWRGGDEEEEMNE